MSCPFRRCSRPTDRNTTSSVGGHASSKGAPVDVGPEAIGVHAGIDDVHSRLGHAPVADQQVPGIVRVGNHGSRTVIDTPGQPGQLARRGGITQLLAVQPAHVRARRGRQAPWPRSGLPAAHARSGRPRARSRGPHGWHARLAGGDGATKGGRCPSPEPPCDTRCTASGPG